MRYLKVVVLVWGTLCFGDVAQVYGQNAFTERIANARQQPQAEKDSLLRQIAIEQIAQHDSIAVFKTLAYIDSPHELAAGLHELQLGTGGGSEPSAGLPVKISETGQGEGGQGGSSLADFTQLIDLIQTTVSPDTWEDTVGGPSTMFPYPAGILVDGQGLVQDVKHVRAGDALDNIEVMINAAGVNDRERKLEHGVDAWRLAATYRCVSLTRLAKEVLRRRINGVPIDESIRNMAGLSRIQYVLFDQSEHDIVLVGPVGGIETRQGWMRDRKSGQVTIRLEYFSTAAASIIARQPFGCSIDPTQQSLAAANKVADQVRGGNVPVGLAADALREAMGKQDVRVFGIAGDTPLAYMMVEADRHMKQLALGLQPMPNAVPNYLDIITRHIAKGPPDGQLLRLWFTGSPMAVRVDEAGTTFELGGRPLKLARETTLAAKDGGRTPAEADFRLTEFVDEFNNHFDDIASLYPVYGALQSAYQAAAVAELLRRSEAATWVPGILGPLLLDDSAHGQLRTPRAVNSVATLHRVSYRTQRHSIIVASGGVMIQTDETLAETFRPYPSLVSIRDRFQPADETPSDSKAVNEAWWWNAK